MGHLFGETRGETLCCFTASCKRLDSSSNSQSPPGELFMLGLSLLVCFMELKKHRVLRRVADAGWIFLRALRAAKEIKPSQQQQQNTRTFESGAFVGACVCRWRAQLSLPGALLNWGRAFFLGTN